MPPDQLVLDPVRDAAQVAAPLLAQHQGEQHDLEEQVTEFAVLRLEVTGGHGVGQLVDLLHGVADDVARRLLPVPGALDAQDVDDALERHQLLAEKGVVELPTGRDGDDRGGRSGGEGRGAGRERPPPKSARQLRPAGTGERHRHVLRDGPADEVVERGVVGGIQLEQPARAG